MGPRCGTSFVMRACVRAGLPVNGVPFISEALTPQAGNPQGYYEMLQPPQQGMVQKVWPVQLANIDPGHIRAMVVLDRRDKDALFASMRQQAQREQMDYPVEQAYRQISDTLTAYLQNGEVDYRLFYTEDLDVCIDEIVAYLAAADR